MYAADRSSAIADCTPLAVVPRSCTTAEIDTFIIDVSTTGTNIAIANSTAKRRFGRPSAPQRVPTSQSFSPTHIEGTGAHIDDGA